MDRNSSTHTRILSNVYGKPFLQYELLHLSFEMGLRIMQMNVVRKKSDPFEKQFSFFCFKRLARHSKLLFIGFK